ncbi:hypothetical protein J1614_005830 [Plenodomus biglobosus]|nr:hypothetical protein J1614_005830 [Plenodomus biglobosus]
MFIQMDYGTDTPRPGGRQQQYNGNFDIGARRTSVSRSGNIGRNGDDSHALVPLGSFHDDYTNKRQGANYVRMSSDSEGQQAAHSGEPSAVNIKSQDHTRAAQRDEEYLETEIHSLEMKLIRKDMEINEARTKILQKNKEINNLRALLTKKDKELHEKDQEIDELKSKVHSFQGVIIQKDKDLHEEKRKANKLSVRLNQMAGTILRSNEESLYAQQALNSIALENTELKRRIEAQNADLISANARINYLEKQRNSAQIHNHVMHNSRNYHTAS